MMTSDGKAWIFRREIEVPVLFLSMGMAGWGLPRLLGFNVDVCTRVGEVTVNENGKIYVTVFGSEEPNYTKHQILDSLGPGWRLVPTEVPMADPGDDVVDDPNAN
jgi:hypothetical protein